MLSFLKKFFGTKPTVSPCNDTPAKVEAPAPAPAPTVTVEGAGLVNTAGITTNWPFPKDEKPAEGEKKAKAKKARAPKEASAAKKPRAKKAKQ